MNLAAKTEKTSELTPIDVWKKADEELRQKIPAKVYEAWFGSIKVAASPLFPIDLVISVPTIFLVRQLEKHIDKIKQCVLVASQYNTQSVRIIKRPLGQAKPGVVIDDSYRDFGIPRKVIPRPAEHMPGERRGTRKPSFTKVKDYLTSGFRISDVKEGRRQLFEFLDIMLVVTLVTDVPEDHIRGRSRIVPVAHARNMFVWLALQLTDFDEVQVGKYCGARIASSISRLNQTADDLLLTDSVFRDKIKEILTHFGRELLDG